MCPGEELFCIVLCQQFAEVGFHLMSSTDRKTESSGKQRNMVGNAYLRKDNERVKFFYFSSFGLAGEKNDFPGNIKQLCVSVNYDGPDYTLM